MRNEAPLSPSERLERPQSSLHSPSPERDPWLELRARCAGVYRELERIIEEVLRRRNVPLHRLATVRLQLEAEFDLSAGSSRGGERSDEFVDRLLTRADEIAQEYAHEGAPFPVGNVFCFWCGGFDCTHAAPPEPRFVFGGYSPTGQPVWAEFATLAVECHHPGVERLYIDNAAPIAITLKGAHLTRDQLGIYGKRSGRYRILGQLALGYIPVGSQPARNGNPSRSRLALSIQVVETNLARRRFHINVLGVLPGGRPAALFLEESLDPRLSDALSSARSLVAELALTTSAPARGPASARRGRPAGNGSRSSRRRRRGAGYRERERWAMGILNRLARTIDRIYRQSSRRTRHAQARHRNPERPTSTALGDAAQARPDDVYRDVGEGTWIVVGPRNRVHVFNDSGHHVTSVVYPGETIRRRTSQGKWKRGTPEELAAFRRSLQSASGEG